MSLLLCNKSDDKNLVIVDQDCGTDDAWALFLLLCSEEKANIQTLGITCTAGNTSVQNVGKNVLRVLEAIDRTDVPIFIGAEGSLIPNPPLNEPPFHGIDGLGDFEREEVDVSLIQEQHAVNFMYDMVLKHPKQISLICIGPLTNLALAIRMYSSKFTENLKDVYIMGGNHSAVGNTTRAAEFNFYSDPEAAYIVMNSLPCPINILPWETCIGDNNNISMEWRENVLGTLANKITNLMNPVDYKLYKGVFDNWIPCDAFLMACIVCPKIVERTNNWHVTIELNGTHTRGQMVLDHLKTNKNNVTIIEKINQSFFQDLLLFTVGFPNIPVSFK